jgi:hypothetical protein
MLILSVALGLIRSGSCGNELKIKGLASVLTNPDCLDLDILAAFVRQRDHDLFGELQGRDVAEVYEAGVCDEVRGLLRADTLAASREGQREENGDYEG